MTNANRQPALLERVDGPVLIVTLNRPERSNTLDPETIRGLTEIIACAEKSGDIASRKGP
jgi:enoyl-CoA hydratase/carnithine racemase